MVKFVAEALGKIDWRRARGRLQILILVKDKKVKDIISAVWRAKEEVLVQQTTFYKAHSKSDLLNAKIKSNLVLFVIGECYKIEKTNDPKKLFKH